MTQPMRIGSLFSGIGGLELGLERSGLGRVSWQCEIDLFCRSVLARHWPDAMRYEDVRTVDATAPSVDVICGGFPCQDVSLAGKRAGLAGERSGLWCEFRRIIAECEPSIVVIENVLGLRTSGLPRVLADLAALGFDAEWSDMSAADVGAPHLRRRLFIVATHTDRIDVRGEPGWLSRSCREAAAESFDDGKEWPASYAYSDIGNIQAKQRDKSSGDDSQIGRWRTPVGPVRGMDDGIPNRSHGRRLRALGNAVVPACAEIVGRAIIDAMRLTS